MYNNLLVYEQFVIILCSFIGRNFYKPAATLTEPTPLVIYYNLFVVLYWLLIYGRKMATDLQFVILVYVNVITIFIFYIHVRVKCL